MMLSAILSFNVFFGMNNNTTKEQISDLEHSKFSWEMHKDLFFYTYGRGLIGTEERWEDFKKGVEQEVITMTPISKAMPNFPNVLYYLAYSKKVVLNNDKTRFMYPSPNNPYSGYPIEDTDVLYTIDEGGTGSLLVNAQWNTNRGVDNANALPLALHPPQEYFPHWKNNEDLWIYWTNIKEARQQKIEFNKNEAQLKIDTK